jgi:hypothetical protein
MHDKIESRPCSFLLVLTLAAAVLAVSCGGGVAAAPTNNTNSADLLLNTNSLDFGSVNVGSSKALSITLSNSSAPGGASITISQMAVTGSAFSTVLPTLPLAIAPGQSSTLTITFAPKASGSATGNLTITIQGSSQPATVPLTGTGSAPGQLALNPSSLSFGNVAVGSSKSLTLSLSNNAPTGSQSISISQIAFTGAAFSAVLPNFPLVLTPGQSYTLTVTFAPAVSGAAIGNISVSVTGSQAVNVGLSGTGLAAGQLAVAPSTLNFGNVNVGNSSNLTGTLTAGSSSVTVSSASWNGQGYSVSGITFPVTISSGQSTTFTVTFAPQASGLSTGGVSFVSNASNSPTNQSFTGTGTQPVQHTVSLSWNASQSQVVGYYIYRSTQSGSYTTPLNNTPQATLTYTDSTVQSAQTYYYVVTAVDSNSQQSVYSNESKAIIP